MEEQTKSREELEADYQRLKSKAAQTVADLNEGRTDLATPLTDTLENKLTGELPFPENGTIWTQAIAECLDHARDLERHLTDARARISGLERERDSLRKELNDERHCGSTGKEWRAAIFGLLEHLGIRKDMSNCPASFIEGWGGPFEFIKQAFTERTELRSALSTAEADARRLREVLQKCEWAYDNGLDDYRCPVCRGWKEHSGHNDNCELAALLAGATGTSV